MLHVVIKEELILCFRPVYVFTRPMRVDQLIAPWVGCQGEVTICHHQYHPGLLLLEMVVH